MTEMNQFPLVFQTSLSSEALRYARQIVGAQAEILADQMDRGAMPKFDGPDALRLLAMILGGEDDTPSHQPIPFSAALAHAA